MSIEPITIPMTLSASEVDIAMGFDTEINVHSGGGSTLQAKTNISPTTSSQTITPDTGYDGLSSVQINAMPSGSATTPATSITANPSISVDSSTGVITASVSKTQSVTPTVSAGYVASGTAGTVTVSGSNTSNLTTQGAQTITPTTSDQTIASGKYLTGAQTIKGDANLVAGNIKKDVAIFGVTGSYEGGGGGITIAPMDYSVTVKNTHSGTKAFRFLEYNSTTLFNITDSNVTTQSTVTKSSMATDGTHFWVKAAGASSVSYNGAACTFVKANSVFKITIPENYDGSSTFDFTF